MHFLIAGGARQYGFSSATKIVVCSSNFSTTLGPGLSSTSVGRNRGARQLSPRGPTAEGTRTAGMSTSTRFLSHPTRPFYVSPQSQSEVGPCSCASFINRGLATDEF